MRSHASWFLLLLAICVVGPSVLGVRPKTNRQWVYIAITIAFIAWLLFIAPLRSR